MRRPPRIRAKALLWVLLCGAAATAFAFNLGGHYYSVLAILSSGNAEIDTGRATEAFCSELPDMSKELDAITLRTDVFWSTRDRAWGSGARCTTSVSRRMVQVQFYLHALTGQGASVSRAAAEKMLNDLGKRISAGGIRQELANLRCERGFATHLLGDTFAHVQLRPDPQISAKYKDPIGVLYETGLGHFRDGVDPDYMLWRTSPEFAEDVQWTGWVKEVANRVDGRAAIQDAKQIIGATSAWRASKGKAAALEAGLIEELKRNIGKPWLSDLPDAKHDWMWSQTQSCATQIKKYFDPLQVAAEDRPDCTVVWHDYLVRAEAAFAASRPNTTVVYGPDASCVQPLAGLLD